jgi:hypothetical protein
LSYTLQQIRDEQGRFGVGIDQFEDEELYQTYRKVILEISKIVLTSDCPRNLTVDNWQDAYKDIMVEGQPWIDTEGENTIRQLIARYEQGLEVYPILLGKDFTIIDGLHRYAALNTLHRRTIWVYLPNID